MRAVTECASIMPVALCVGHCTVDTIGVVEQFPGADEKVELSAFSLQGGGPAATAAACLAALDVSTAFIGKISDDWHGNLIRQGLEDAGIDISGLVTHPGAVSASTFIAVDRHTQRRIVLYTMGSVPPLAAEEVNLRLLDSVRVVLLDGYQIQGQIAVAEAARNREIPVILDAGSVRAGMDDLAALSTVVIASERFARELAGSVDKSVEALIKLGPHCAVVTLGEDGSVGREAGGASVMVPALSIDAVDMTGAGDVYRGAFAYGVLKGWDLKQKMRFASVAAGLKCRSLGGREGLPGLQEIEKVLAEGSV
jgi:sulfofructose kinase